jgi:hypothetical protein
MEKHAHGYHRWMLLDGYVRIKSCRCHTCECLRTWSKLWSTLINSSRQSTSDVISGQIRIYLKTIKHGFFPEGSCWVCAISFPRIDLVSPFASRNVSHFQLIFHVALIFMSIVGWFFDTWFLPMVFYFRLRN